jgi:integrase
MAKKKLNHHLYEDEKSGVWYFQKKVRGIQKPYKFSLGTTLVGEARKKRDEYLRQVIFPKLNHKTLMIPSCLEK